MLFIQMRTAIHFLLLAQSWGEINLALSKQAEQSGDYRDVDGNKYLASRAVDGDIETFSHTDLDSALNWWRVDLGAKYTFGSLKIYNRGDNSNAQLKNVSILVSNATLPSAPYLTSNDWTRINYQSVYSDVEYHSFEPPIDGQYLAVYNKQAGGLALGEVEVYEFNYARNKSTDSSSSKSTSQLAVDRNLATIFSTNKEQSPWWKVDLSVAILLREVLVFAKDGECYPGPVVCWTRLMNVYFLTNPHYTTKDPNTAGNDGWNSCYYSASALGSTFSIECNQGSSSKPITRLFSIQITSETYLQLRQVEVYGFELPQLSGTVDGKLDISSTSITVSFLPWNQLMTGGAPPTGYRVQLLGGVYITIAHSSNSGRLSTTFNGLDPGQTYTFTVSCTIQGIACTGPTHSFTASTSCAVPDKPGQITLSYVEIQHENRQKWEYTATWGAPNKANCAGPIQYQYNLVGQPTTLQTTTTATFYLDGDQPFEFIVRAKNSVGFSVPRSKNGTSDVLVFTEDFAISNRCNWSSGSGKLEGYIPGTPSTVSVTNGSEECKDSCMSQSTFICAAVNYRVSVGLCELLSENNQTSSVVEPFDGSWLYFIRPLCAGIWLPWQAEKGISIVGSELIDSNETRLQDCLTNCLRYDDGAECRAVNIRTSSSDNNNCKLWDVRVGEDDVTTSENSTWQYFNRPSWYLDSSPGSMKAEITDLGNIGYSLYIFTELRIPVDGYLVAWQYYMNTDSPCASYAAIWREVGVYSYKLISKTLLTPEQPTEAGVRFQFIQNEVIRVRSGDILSVHTEKGAAEGGCTYNMVSGNLSEGGETIEFSNSSNGVDVTHIKTSSQLDPRLISAALKAYVSEYLTLPEPPQIITISSKSPVELRLRFPDLPAVDESAVIVGYKVICSTDALFNETIPCYNDSLVSVGTRDVVLNLPDEPMTYYIAVQMVRDFNGQLLFEEKYSTTSYDREIPKMPMEMILIIGLGVGGGCLLLGGLILIICCCVRRRRGNNTSQDNADRRCSLVSPKLPTAIQKDSEPDDPEANYETIIDSDCKSLAQGALACYQPNASNQFAEVEYDEAQADQPDNPSYPLEQYCGNEMLKKSTAIK